ncbi:hypothetical protein D0463_19050 [Bacillus sp. V59.32b]|nr:hypothetical protein D0463_19050 [Bacillus sp. V59.32b]
MKGAHVPSLKDFALLVGPTITNKQLREFLRLPSISIATKMLVAQKFKYSGSKKGRIYELDFPEEK